MVSLRPPPPPPPSHGQGRLRSKRDPTPLADALPWHPGVDTTGQPRSSGLVASLGDPTALHSSWAMCGSAWTRWWR